MKVVIAVLAALSVGSVVAPTSAAPAGTVYALDGDSVRVGSVTVRLLGVDTPEYGRCGSRRATALTRKLIADGVRVNGRQGTDRYGRTLAYLTTASGRDVGTVLLRKGLAIARYDSRDGYPWHPKEAKYRRLDAAHNARVCF